MRDYVDKQQQDCKSDCCCELTMYLVKFIKTDDFGYFLFVFLILTFFQIVFIFLFLLFDYLIKHIILIVLKSWKIK
jgi:hypothetical protein